MRKVTLFEDDEGNLCEMERPSVHWDEICLSEGDGGYYVCEFCHGGSAMKYYESLENVACDDCVQIARYPYNRFEVIWKGLYFRLIRLGSGQYLLEFDDSDGMNKYGWWCPVEEHWDVHACIAVLQTDLGVYIKGLKDGLRTGRD